ncbi:MAG: hypothetical protein ACRBK7_13920 [Acidimicrobiales bacterium]
MTKPIHIRTHRRLATAARYSFAAVAAACLVAGCGQAEAFDRAAAIESFSNANPVATPEQSECVVDRLVDRYGLEGLRDELDAEPQDQAFSNAQFRDMFACSMDGDVRDQIDEQLQANGVAAKDAPCVADAMVDELTDDDFDVLLSGEITDDFFSKFVSAMEECGAINS